MAVTSLKTNEINGLMQELSGWELVDGKKLRKSFQMKTYMEAIELINKISKIADLLDHHPDVFNSYTHVGIEIFTHKIDGLTKLDFVLAKKIDSIIENDF